MNIPWGNADRQDFPDNPTAGQMVFRVDLGQLFVWLGNSWSMISHTQRWHLFLDDERFPAEAGWAGLADVVIARSSAEAEKLVIERGLPSSISFDHDLGGDDTAFKFMWRLINGHLDDEWDLAAVAAVQVHSANIEGAKKLISLWENFCRVQNIKCAITRVWPGAQSE